MTLTSSELCPYFEGVDRAIAHALAVERTHMKSTAVSVRMACRYSLLYTTFPCKCCGVDDPEPCRLLSGQAGMESCCKRSRASGCVVAHQINIQSLIQPLAQHYIFLIPEIPQYCIVHIFSAQCTHVYSHNRRRLSIKDLSCSTSTVCIMASQYSNGWLISNRHYSTWPSSACIQCCICRQLPTAPAGSH